MAPSRYNSNENVPAIFPVIKYGKYKGKSDTRAQRCLHTSFNERRFPCRYCKSLPYELSKLKTECKPEELAHLDNKLGFTLDLLIKSPEMDKYGAQMRPYITIRSLSLVRAREQMNRLASMFRTGQFMSTQMYLREPRSPLRL